MGPNSYPRGGGSLSVVLADKNRRNRPSHVDASVSVHVDKRYWTAASYTLASGISWTYKSSDYDVRRALVLHVDSCINLCKDVLK
jgi:hypothetical protein